MTEATTAATTTTTSSPITPSATPPTTPQEAGARIKAIAADKEYGAKYRAGSLEHVAEIKALNKIIAGEDLPGLLDRALSGTLPKGMGGTTRDGQLLPDEYVAAAEKLVPSLGAEAFKEVVLGTPVTQERHDEAAQLRKVLLSDREWTKKFREGSEAHKVQMTRINAVLIAPIEGKEKS